jgi:ATP-dependent RNA helicase DeaD
MPFKKLGIKGKILDTIIEEKFEKPSEIQEKTIPLILKGRDVIGGAATGSGKTLAFGAGIIQNIHKGGGIQSLILTPTRELAEQVSKTLKKFSKHDKLNVTSIYGGVGIHPQIKRLTISDIVVGTPGRILDHLERGTLNLSFVKILVLDEADRMLDMGFIDDVKKIISACPKKRQTLLFSATISRDITTLAKKYMVSPIKISAESNVDPKKLVQVYYNVQENQKLSLLVHFLKNEKKDLVMVFCNSKRTTDFVAKNLYNAKIKAQAIHGGFSQDKRNKTLDNFHSQKVFVLVCTDVAARGLDIKGVSHVYNYDIPRESKQYIHRIGRTARAGKEGKAINFLSHRDHEDFSRVLRDNDVTVKKKELPKFETIQIKSDSKSKFGARPKSKQRFGLRLNDGGRGRD